MTNVTDSARSSRRLITGVKAALRDLNTQMLLLSRQFGAQVELKEVDWTCLDLLNRHGQTSPTALARRAGLHPATVTGILDRLQKGGWVKRERDPDSTDRRAVTVVPQRERNAELFAVFAGMNARMDQVCARYTPAELELIADFLCRTTAAGQESATELAGD